MTLGRVFRGDLTQQTVLWLSLSASGCGGAVVTAEHPRAPAIPDEQRALAPDLAVRVDRAVLDGRDAERAGDAVAVEEHRQRAEFLLQALDAEAGRIVLERERKTLELEIERWQTARAEADAQRLQVESELQRQRAAELAREEASRVFSIAEQEESRRRGGDSARVQERKQAALAALDRATTILAAASALGADAPTIAKIHETLTALRTKLDGSASSLSQAQAVWLKAQHALGAARRQRGEVTAAERASLHAALEQHGALFELLPDGVAVVVPTLFVGNRTVLAAAARDWLAALVALLAGHPHGSVVGELAVPTAAPKATVSRQLQLVQALLSDVGASRLQLRAVRADAERAGSLRLLLSAYGCHALTNEGGACISP